MKISEKINLDKEELVANGPITIVAFGDSVTHGALGAGEINYETVYWRRLSRMINAVRSYVPVNVINAGIGGTTAKGSVGRMDAQVLSHNPDLVIVSFGLNDVNGTLEDYLSSLRTIFERCLENGADVIFLTPNMLNTYVAPETAPGLREYAKKTADMQNSGRMDEYIAAAVRLADSMGVPVADAYSEWKRLASDGRDTTALLANRINHPTKEMHELFARLIFEKIFPENTKGAADSDTMYDAKN